MRHPPPRAPEELEPLVGAELVVAADPGDVVRKSPI